jgi:hypothetical protein
MDFYFIKPFELRVTHLTNLHNLAHLPEELDPREFIIIDFIELSIFQALLTVSLTAATFHFLYKCYTSFWLYETSFQWSMNVPINTLKLM